MSKLAVFIVGMLFTLGARADGPRDGAHDLLNAITLCASPNNPLKDGLEKLNGDIFGNAVADDDQPTGAVLITASVISSPHSHNGAIMAPDRIVGSVHVKMSYQRRGYDRPLKCELKLQH